MPPFHPEKSSVYFTREISAESLIRIYDAMGRHMRGNLAVKIETGHLGGPHHLKPTLVAPLIQRIHGTILECCSAYNGESDAALPHWKEIEMYGFRAITPAHAMDALALPPSNPAHGIPLTKGHLGGHLGYYDAMLVLSHFKGHIVTGFGGALKNLSLGVAPLHESRHQFVAEPFHDPDNPWKHQPKQYELLKWLAKAGQEIVNDIGAENLLYINVANCLSVDCDCDATPEPPEMPDIGIFASIDPVALDQACYDAVKYSPNSKKRALVHRMDSRHAEYILEAAEELGIGSRSYKLVDLDSSAAENITVAAPVIHPNP